MDKVMTVASPARRLAIIAHFDPEGSISPHFILLLEDARSISDHIVIVSTHLTLDHANTLASFGTVLIRSNTGYDFASWRFGLDYARRHFLWDNLDEIVLLNDSVFLLRKDVLRDAIEKMSEKPHDIVALVSSHQVRFHLMSFFLVFRRRAFLNRWFDQFWSSIWDYGDRDFVIWHYELDLAAQALLQGMSVAALLDPMTDPVVAQDQRLSNPAHMYWEVLAERHGIAKIELVRSNPLKRDLSGLRPYASPSWKAITHYMERHAALPPRSPPMSALEEAKEYASTSVARIALHVHLHDINMLDEMLRFSQNVPPPSDIFVTTTIKDELLFVIRGFKAQNRNARILPVTSVGGDVLPFLQLAKTGVFAPYAAVCKIHSGPQSAKDNLPAAAPEKLLGSSRQALEILTEFKTDPNLGIVTSALTPERGIGSMYWFRPAALPILSSSIPDTEDFKLLDPLKRETLAQTMDSLPDTIARTSNYKIRSVDGISVASI
jgi:lipopolysaccharide biosynthesis protein